MVCKTCGCELGAVKMRTIDSDGKIIIEQDFACKNKRCAEFNKVVETKQTEIID